MKNNILTKIMDKAKSTAGITGLKIREISPEILIGAGVVGIITSTVMACKATTKAKAILEETKENLDAIHKCAEDEKLKEKYTEKDVRKDTAITYAQTGAKFIKLYTPSIIIGAASISLIFASHGIMRKRNASLMAAYAAIDTSFKKYRKRVAEKYGEEEERDIRHNVKVKEFTETEVDENGKKKKVKKSVKYVNSGIDGYSDYSRFFDESSPEWEKDSEYNLMFLKAQQDFMNQKLRAQGYLFLNDVYDALGIPKTKAGQIVGWIYDPENGDGDNYVDFGIYVITDERKRDFVNGYENVILLDFNVDGVIWDKIKEMDV